MELIRLKVESIGKQGFLVCVETLAISSDVCVSESVDAAPIMMLQL